MTKRWFNVGKIVNTHGIKGEVRVISKTDFAEERYKPGNTLYLFMDGSNEPVEVTVNTHRLHKQFHLLQFKERQSLNEVEKLKNAIIKVPEEDLGELNEGEFYFHEIIGCEVFTEDGELIGKVKEILTPGANDVWVIGRKGKKTHSFLTLNQWSNISMSAKKKIEIELMEGLIDE